MSVVMMTAAVCTHTQALTFACLYWSRGVCLAIRDDSAAADRAGLRSSSCSRLQMAALNFSCANSFLAAILLRSLHTRNNSAGSVS